MTLHYIISYYSVRYCLSQSPLPRASVCLAQPQKHSPRKIPVGKISVRKLAMPRPTPKAARGVSL